MALPAAYFVNNYSVANYVCNQQHNQDDILLRSLKVSNQYTLL